MEASDDDVDQPTYFPEQRVVATPLGDRLRLTGMLHLTGTDMRVDARSVAAVRERVAGALRPRRVVQMAGPRFELGTPRFSVVCSTN